MTVWDCQGFLEFRLRTEIGLVRFTHGKLSGSLAIFWCEMEGRNSQYSKNVRRSPNQQQRHARVHATTANFARAIPPKTVALHLSNTNLHTCRKVPPGRRQKRGNTPSTTSLSSAVPTRAQSGTACEKEPLGLQRTPAVARSHGLAHLKMSGCHFLGSPRP